MAVRLFAVVCIMDALVGCGGKASAIGQVPDASTDAPSAPHEFLPQSCNSVCAHPIAFEALVAYWSGDLPSEDEDALELHVMGCAECTASSERVAAVALSVRSSIPALLTNRLVAKLRARGVRIEENPMVPGERKPVLFRRAVDVLLHRLGGLDLANASEVSVVIRDGETGNVMYEETPAAFDAATGEVLVACQHHFAAFPTNVVIEVRATGSADEPIFAKYMIPHTFEGAAPT